MGARAEKKAAAHERPEGPARSQAEAKRRRGRLVALAVGSVVVSVAIVIAVILSKGPAPPPNATPSFVTAAQAMIAGWVAGTAQNGTTWGEPNAQVTDREYIDPQCPACDQEFVGASRTLGPIAQLSALVRAGELKIEFIPLETVTPTAGMLEQEWAAVLAAGRQKRAVSFLFTNYVFQPPEGSGRFNEHYVEATALATQGLDYAQWSLARTSPGVSAAALAALKAADRSGFTSTPTAVFSSARGRRVVSGAQPASVYADAVRSLARR